DLGHGGREAVDLIDEEDVALREVGEDADQSSEVDERRPLRLVEGGAQLAGHELRQSGLPEARRPGEERVPRPLAAEPGGAEREGEVLAGAALAVEVVEAGERLCGRGGGGELLRSGRSRRGRRSARGFLLRRSDLARALRVVDERLPLRRPLEG